MAKKRIPSFLIVVFFLLPLIAGSGYFLFHQFSKFSKTPANPDAGQSVFIISAGENLKTIAINLKKNGIISNNRYFIWYVKFKKAGKRLQAGEYILSASISPEQIIDILVAGKVKLYKITFPEGLNIKEVANRIETAGFCSQNEFIALCFDKAFIQSLGINAQSLEGYLFPDTYFFPKKSDGKTLLSAMVARFKLAFTPEWEMRANQLGFSVFEIITLASIIEKETGDASERPIIASVFHNRLKKNMRLESDPTVIYGIKDFDGNIKRKHLRMITPYNTYKIKGLPAGPIANPGVLSIQAALYPAQTDYLFFVSKKDTTHYFSKTIQEHNRAVRKYQL
ncbi:MAG: endolytic transglycosylase MltG [Pseudomonadota bacterium]